MAERPPRRFGKYVLLKPLAKGGMGEIWMAAGGDIGGFEKLCVIKKVLAEKADKSKSNRFLDEAKVVLRLSHSALVHTFDAGEVDGEFYIAMELVEGKDLREVWNRCVRLRQRIPLDVALHLVREVARALAYVHAYGDLKLVHRDVAPPNILLAYVGDVKLTDFGLARSVLKQEHTAPGVVFGRAAYLAPEQARGEQADARTDVYTLGIVLWELLTGQQYLQLSGLDPVAALAVVRNPRVAAPSAHAPWITRVLDDTVMRALAPDRKNRYQSAEEMRQALSDTIAQVAPRADAGRLAEFLRGIYGETIEEERARRERVLREIIPRFRDESAAQAAAVGPPAPATVTLPAPFPAGARERTQPDVPASAADEPADPTEEVPLADRGRRDGAPPPLPPRHGKAPPSPAAGEATAAPRASRALPLPGLAPRAPAAVAPPATPAAPPPAPVPRHGTSPEGSPTPGGTTLAALMAEEMRLEARRAADIARFICRALAPAHDAGRFQQDLAPERVIVLASGEGVRIRDGAAVAGRGDPASGPTVAPERALGESPTARSDVYAVGALLYEMITGSPPYAGTEDMVRRKAVEPPQSPRLFRPDLPLDLERVILATLDPHPGMRSPSLSALAGALGQVSWSPQPRDEGSTVVKRMPAQPAPRPTGAPAAAEAPAPEHAWRSGAHRAVAPDSPSGAHPAVPGTTRSDLPPPATAAPRPVAPLAGRTFGSAVLARYGAGEAREGGHRGARAALIAGGVVLLLLALAKAFGVL